MTTFRSKFVDIVRLYADGACPGKVGPSAAGIVLFDRDWRELHREGRILGDGTVNTAEYRAIIMGLDVAAAYTRIEVECYTDSDVVAGQISARYRIRDSALRELFRSVKEHELAFRSVVYQKTGRTDQRLGIADRLANDALNSRATRQLCGEQRVVSAQGEGEC